MIKITSKLYVHFTTLLVFAAAYFFGMLEQTMVIFVVAFLHEMFHLAAALALKEKAQKVIIMPYGCELKLSAISSPSNEIIIAAAGPCFNLAAALLASRFPLGETFYFMNLAMLFMNVLPVLPLDGGRVLRGILSYFFGSAAIFKAMRFLSFFVAAALVLCGGVLLYLSRYNFSLLIIGVFLLAGIIKEDPAPLDYRLLTGEGEITRPVQKTCELTVLSDTAPHKVLGYLPKSGYVLITVVDQKGKILGRLSKTQLISGMLTQRAGAKVSELLKNG